MFFFGHGHKKERRHHFFIWKMHTHVLCRWKYRAYIESAKETIMMMLLCREWIYEDRGTDCRVHCWLLALLCFLKKKSKIFSFLLVCKKKSLIFSKIYDMLTTMSQCGSMSWCFELQVGKIAACLLKSQIFLSATKFSLVVR